jgi:hypothetical protein
MFEAYSVNFIVGPQRAEDGSFFAQVHCEVREHGKPGGEAFVAYLVGPTDESSGDGPRVQKGKLTISTLNKMRPIEILQEMVDATQAQNWDQLYARIGREFEWV